MNAAFLKSEAAARRWLEGHRWPRGIACPYCGSRKFYEKVGGMPYRCAACVRYFSVRTGTVMEKSKLPLLKWVRAIYLVSTDGAVERNGDALALHRQLGIDYRTGKNLHRLIMRGYFGGEEV